MFIDGDSHARHNIGQIRIGQTTAPGLNTYPGYIIYMFSSDVLYLVVCFRDFLFVYRVFRELDSMLASELVILLYV